MVPRLLLALAVALVGCCTCGAPKSPGGIIGRKPVTGWSTTSADISAVVGPAAARVQPTCSNASDCSVELQAALDGCASEVVLTQLPAGRNWVTQPLFVRNCKQEQRLHLSPGVVLEAIKGGFHDKGSTLLEVSNVTGFTLHGPGATLRMHRADYNDSTKYTHSEGRMAIALRGVTNVVISGEPGNPLTVTESGGDGCYISHLFGSVPAQNSRNVTITDVNFTKNYRQGISVIGVVGLTVTNTELSLTAGTPPEAGIDFEPDEETNELADIVFTNVTARGNMGRGFQWSLQKLTPATPSPVSVTLNDCTVDGGHNAAVSISVNKLGLPPGGHVTFNRLQTHNSQEILAEDKPSSLQLNLVNSSIFNVSAAAPAPIWVEGRNALCAGVHLDNVTVHDFVHRSAIDMKLGAVQGVTGDLRVINPTGCVPPHITGTGNTLKITCTRKATANATD